MESTAILDFEWILLFAAIAGMAAVRLRMPPVAGLLLAGMVMGPNMLNLVDLPTIDMLAELGAVLLLFMIGVEFSITKLLSSGLRAIISSFILVFLTFTVMHEVSILLGYDYLTSLFIAAMLSLSSTAIMMKILEQKRLTDRQETPVLITILIIEDLIAVFMLTFFSSMKSGTFSSEDLIGAVLISLAVMVFAYLVLLRILKKFSMLFLRYQAEDTLILFAFALGVGMSVLASVVGLTPSIGAFLAGSMIAGLPIGRDVEQAIRPFSHVFSSFFFLSVGMLISPAALAVSADMTMILIGAFMATVFLATAFTFFLISSSGRSSVFAGLAMLPLGEFSLLIAKESVGVVTADLVGIASIGVLLTSLVCSVSLNRSERIYAWLKHRLPVWFLDSLRDASGYFRNVLCAFEPGGYFHRLFVAELKKSFSDLFYLVGALIFYYAARPFLQFEVALLGFSMTAHTALLAIMAALFLVSLTRLLLSLKRLFDALATIFSRTTPQASQVSIVRNILIAGTLFMLFANSYLVVDVLKLPREFNWASILFGVLSVFFLWSAIRASSLWLFLREHRPMDILKNQIMASKDDYIVVGGNGSSKGGEKRQKGKAKKKVIFLR
ncbi:cation:proton antiporter [Candidatus Micrarchaeota archaeon]|nr:cation:proton antiporter [Candidatus Micrarchaeota archaeon]